MAQIVNKLNLNRVPQLVDNNSLIFAKNVRLSANGFSPDYGFDKITETPFRGDEIVGIIPYNTKFYVLLYHDGVSEIKEYDEKTNRFTHVACNWNYSGGVIDGNVVTNLNGQTVITIAEHDTPDGTLVPLKTICIPEADESDDESIYTQSPNVPFINLSCKTKYYNTIPAGTYQFFVRYEIRKDFYTNWFPASKELFAGTARTIVTNQGKLHYIDVNIDSNESFVLDVEQIVTVSGFKSFQLGFIIAHDDEVYARAYKHYDILTSKIYFDYDTEYIEEIDVSEILESVYSLYNVKNITNFKNKQYISNYIESDFNPLFDSFADSIRVTIKKQENTAIHRFKNSEYISDTLDGVEYIASIISKSIDGEHTSTISDLVRNVLCNTSVTTWLTNPGNGSRTPSFKGVTALLHKTYETDPEPGGGGEIISPDDPTTTPTSRVYRLYDYYTGTQITSNSDINSLLTLICNSILGIRINNPIVLNTNGDKAGFRIDYDTYSATHQTTKLCSVSIEFKIDPNDIDNEYNLNNVYTLVPHQKYDFYVHLVRANGEITNGIKIPEQYVSGEYLYSNNEIKESISGGSADAIYPTFTFTKQLPDGYVACFISIVHTENNVAQLFNVETNLPTINERIADCIELDARLYPALKDIPVVINNTETMVDYRASYDTEFLATFGTSGKCVFKDDTATLADYGFVKLPYQVNEKYLQLTRCTPFISYDSVNFEYDEYNSLNLLGYICKVTKLKDNIDSYFSGSDIYDVTRPYDLTSQSYKLLLSVHPSTGNKWQTYYDTPTYTIYSNFNLNYLSLRETLNYRIVTKNIGTDETPNNKQFVLLSFESLNLSEVYELKSMFYSYTRKLYEPYTDYNTITKFDNTIRSSELNGDENVINIFKFKSSDYYNVPTDKGMIINLVAVGDNILVHTQDSIYKFTGNNTLSANGGEDVQMKESQPFDTGIQELFGSEFGYAGLQNKRHQVLSEMGYTFYDSDCQRIYYYTGNANIKVISDDISKLFKYKPVNDIHFADDYYNNRVFICLDFGNEQYATLTYDFAAKGFISLHDFHFDWAFKTKTKCYFVNPDKTDIYKVSDTTIADYPVDFSFEDKLYPTGENKECIIDVIYNEGFEAIKTLNAISWVCNKVKDFLEEVTTPNEDMLVAEEWFDPMHSYKGEVLRIYSDSVKTPAIDISDKTNEHSITQVASYDRPRYNLGKWTFNYFRNILNRNQDPTLPRVFGEQDTLLYGKYFVARFIFNRAINFKIEDVTFEISNDYNV